MFSYWKAARDARAARRAYDLAVLEGLIADNNARLAELREAKKCPWCAPEAQFTRG